MSTARAWALSVALLIGPAAGPTLELAPCSLPGVPGEARCGSLTVFENRAARSGRTIELRVAVLPATGKHKQPDPVFFLQGGPGGSAVMVAPLFAHSELREQRDVVLVDQRGTGESGALRCDGGDLQEQLDMLSDFDFGERAAACRDRLDADLTLYTTTIAMDDLDDVRRALGVEKINLFGGSYGTRAALEYLRRHGAHVRTATLTGVAPTDFDLPLGFARDSGAALDSILDDCAADRSCNAAFPDVRNELRTVLKRLAQEPVTVSIDGPAGEPTSLHVDRAMFVGSLHYAMYVGSMAAGIPQAIHAAYGGDFTPAISRYAFFAALLEPQISFGLFLSVVCAEDVPYYDAADIEREAKGTLLGETMSRNLKRACAEWPRATIPADYKDPVVSDVPVLLLTGEADPVTPGRHAAAAARHLSNSSHIVVPDGAHSVIGERCADGVIARFVDQGRLDGLDAGCIDRLRRRFAMPTR